MTPYYDDGQSRIFHIESNRLGHPAPFPLGLPMRALEATGAVSVLDPFMGSGTTLRAAKDLGTRGVGIEVSERYCDMAVARLAQGALAQEVSG